MSFFLSAISPSVPGIKAVIIGYPSFVIPDHPSFTVYFLPKVVPGVSPIPSKTLLLTIVLFVFILVNYIKKFSQIFSALYAENEFINVKIIDVNRNILTCFIFSFFS